MLNLRKYVRANMPVDVEYSMYTMVENLQSHFQTIINNMSVEGASLLLPSLIPKGQEIQMQFTLPRSGSVTLRALIMYSHPSRIPNQYKSGVCFMYDDAKDYKAVTLFIRDLIYAPSNVTV